MHPANDLWVLWLLTGLLWLNLSWLIAYHLRKLTAVTQRAHSKPRIPKPLTPHSEDDCPHCRTNAVRSTRLRPADPPPPPWSQVKSPRGRKKSIPTQGYACLNAQCPYRLITNARVHALVGDGFHGRDHIPDLRCQACSHKFSARRDTALYGCTAPHVSPPDTGLDHWPRFGAARRRLRLECPATRLRRSRGHLPIVANAGRVTCPDLTRSLQSRSATRSCSTRRALHLRPAGRSRFVAVGRPRCQDQVHPSARTWPTHTRPGPSPHPSCAPDVGACALTRVAHVPLASGEWVGRQAQ